MVRNVNYVILGAGPSGLAFANRLLERGVESFVVIDKEKEAGGLCRSVEVDGSPLDIGGGHFLDVKRDAVVNLLFKFLPKNEWRLFQRKSTIRINGKEIDYPFEASIWQLPEDDQVGYLESIAKAGCIKGQDNPSIFSEWIRWKLGDRIAEAYMLPYNRKIWSTDLNELGTYWLYKLPDVSFSDTLKSCLNKKRYGAIPAHDSFYYPAKYGYGEIWKRMAVNLGNKLITNFPLESFDIDRLTINDSYRAEEVINTIPWSEIKKAAFLPDAVKSDIDKLRHTSVEVAYFSENIKTKSHWTYFPDESLDFHRTVYRHNFLKSAKGYTTETNAKRVKEKKRVTFFNQYAYPLNTIDKPQVIKNILGWFGQKSVFGLGRWGEWEHMNSDVAVERGMSLADRMVGAWKR